MSNNNQPTPKNIMHTAMGFMASKVLLTAVKLDLFTLLAEKKSMSGAEIKSALGFGCTPRHCYDFLDALVSTGFLQREGVWDGAKYSNSADTDLFLDKKKPSYIGGLVVMANNRLYPFWGDLEAGLKTGEAQNEIKHGGGNLFEALYGNHDRLKEFIHAMTGVQMGNFALFAQTFDFSNRKTLADIGGSGAMLSIMVAKHQPHMSCVSYDLPPVAPIAQENINAFGVAERVKTGALDFFKDNFATADVIVMGNILHDWDEQQKLMLMKKAYDALPAGGVFVAIENVIDDERKANTLGLMMSLNMLIETATGFDYTFSDFNGWAKQCGFSRTEIMSLAGPASAAIAYK